METALKILSDEHKNILKVINALLKECDSIQSENKIDKIYLSQIIDFVRGYADKFHHAKEENILFKEFNICAEEGCVHCNPVDQMLHEHDLGRNYIKELEIGIKEENKSKILQNARGYSQLLKEHIFKEDNILYPMMDEAFNEKIKVRILDKFKQVEKELIKDKEKYSAFLEELKHD